MRIGSAEIEIRTSEEASFDLIHDYSRRLEWDSFLRAAYLLDDAKSAGLDVTSRCIARRFAGGFAMDTMYVSFDQPHVAAVKMIRGPFFFRKFAATIRHAPTDDKTTRITYIYSFQTKPSWLAFLLEPIVERVFLRETESRLAALKSFLEAGERPTLTP